MKNAQVRRGRRHEVMIEGKTIWLDSLNEYVALQRIIGEYNFVNRWHRPDVGIKQAGLYYTPDFELAIDDNGNTARALVEVKQYRKELSIRTSYRMRVAAWHYRSDFIYLYAVKSDKWYKVGRRDGAVRQCSAPLPGKNEISRLWKPKRIIVRNSHGRRYYQSYVDIVLSIIREFV